ncbi:MAG: hypothetical protein KTM48_01595 [Wolbachia endosymbiont of Pissodes strobi]|nr:hypothetical protein [Wolbachia endosymbiont of Pissodes strobi]
MGNVGNTFSHTLFSLSLSLSLSLFSFSFRAWCLARLRPVSSVLSLLPSWLVLGTFTTSSAFSLSLSLSLSEAGAWHVYGQSHLLSLFFLHGWCLVRLRQVLLSLSLFPRLVLDKFTPSLICTISLSHAHVTYLSPFLIVVAK